MIINPLPPSLFDFIGNLINLKKLYCCINKLTSLPDSIGNLFNLKHLICFDNKLTLLPESIGDLINLKVVCCYNNQIENLPKTIINLRNIVNFNKDELTLTPQQERYFNWIKSKKKYEFDEHVNVVMVKCAYFGV